MDQDMNAYLEQLRARAEKRLQNESETTTPKTDSSDSFVAQSVKEEVKPSSLSVDEIIKEADTLRYDVPSVTYDNDSEKMMDDLMDWADRAPTVPFEPVAVEEAASPVNVAPPVSVKEDKVDTVEEAPIKKETAKKTAVYKKESKTSDLDEDVEQFVEAPKKVSKRDQRKQAREFRRALVEKENGSGRGIIGEIFYVILFIILVILTILAVLYLLQTIAGIKILDVESIFDLIFNWISSKILH